MSRTKPQNTDLTTAPPIMHPPAFAPRGNLRQHMEQAFLSSFVLKGGQQKLDALLETDPEQFLEFMLKFMPKEQVQQGPKSIEEFLTGLKDANVIEGTSEEIG